MKLSRITRNQNILGEKLKAFNNCILKLSCLDQEKMPILFVRHTWPSSKIAQRIASIRLFKTVNNTNLNIFGMWRHLITGIVLHTQIKHFQDLTHTKKQDMFGPNLIEFAENKQEQMK